MTDESVSVEITRDNEEANNQDECKEVALRIFEDACILYNEERYWGALYLSGYVIENGVKSELYRFENMAQTRDQLLTYLGNILREILSEVMSSHNENRMSTFFTELEKRLKDKNTIQTYFFGNNKDSTHIPAIYSMRKKRAPSTENDKNHDVEAFLKQLEYWRKQLAVNEDEINPDDYKINDWTSSLRYYITRSNYTDEQVRTHQRDRAKEALNKAYLFLEKVVYKRNDFLINDTAKQFVRNNCSRANEEVSTITTSSVTNNR